MRVVVPIVEARSGAKQVIPDIDVKNTVVTLEGKGRDLLGVKPRQLAFRLEIPDGKSAPANSSSLAGCAEATAGRGSGHWTRTTWS